MVYKAVIPPSRLYAAREKRLELFLVCRGASDQWTRHTSAANLAKRFGMETELTKTGTVCEAVTSSASAWTKAAVDRPGSLRNYFYDSPELRSTFCGDSVVDLPAYKNVRSREKVES